MAKTTIVNTDTFGEGFEKQNAMNTELYKTVTVVTTATYDIIATDKIVHVTRTTAGTCAIAIPAAQIINARVIDIVDAGNGANTYNITITPATGQIQHDTSLVMNTNGQSVTLYCYDGNIFIK